MPEQKLNVVIFAGGRGSTTISSALLKHPQIDLTVLVNTYDDGLSTGRLRQFIPGMLGPSDVRKNFVNHLGDTGSEKALKFLLEYRLPDNTLYEHGLNLISSFDLYGNEIQDPVLKAAYRNLELRCAENFSIGCKAFLRYALEQQTLGKIFNFADCSLGNIVFSGFFLLSGRNLNETVTQFSELCQCKAKILNITDGKDLILMAIKEDGKLLKREAEVVSEQDSVPISEIFLLENYLSLKQIEDLEQRTLAEKINFLRGLSKMPVINPSAKKVISEADIIIYGPGTQHSSLFPSYLTKELTEAIRNNHTAEKFFVANIKKDFEIQSETAASLTRKALFYLSRKNEISFEWHEVITHFFFQMPRGDSFNKEKYVSFQSSEFPYPLSTVVVTDWEIKEGVHSGGKVLDELIRAVNAKLERKLKPFHYMISIVVPGLNEKRTVKTVLHDLSLLDFQPLGLGKEIIFVDGGSTDGTLEEARSENDVKIFSTQGKGGRGEAIRLGIQKATGNIVAIFHSDGEYKAEDLLIMANALVKNEFPVVFGSRAIKCVDLSDQIRQIYKGNRIGYVLSKYGGMLLSILNLLFFNRFVSDPLTGIKIFNGGLIKDLNLESSGFELETEILAKLGRKKTFILEVPVNYKPRKKHEGKKTTMFDGIKAIITLFRFRFARDNT